MAYLDEDIAKRLKEQRMKRIAEEEKRKEKELEAQIDPEEIKKGILAGECEVLDRTFQFKKYDVCDGRFGIYIPYINTIVQNDLPQLFKTADNELGFSCTVSSTNEKKDFFELDHYKKMMKKNLKQVTFKWLEEGAELIGGYKVSYLDFITLTGLGNIHQSMWFVMGPHGQTQIVVNYDHQEDRYFKHLVKGLRETLEINA